MSKKYKIIGGFDVFKILIAIDLDVMSPLKCINLVNIASLLGTSRYQVKMYMDRLVNAGVAEIERTTLYDEYGVIPYCGYKLTDTVKIKSGDNIDNSLNKSYILQMRAVYQRKKAESERLIKECFDS